MPQPASASQQVAERDWHGDGKPHPNRRLTEEEFVEWVGEKTRAEWVDGEVIMMSPVSDDHDDFKWWLRTVMHKFAKHGKLGRVKGPEFMMRLGPERAWRAPDVLFVGAHRLEAIKRNRVEGPPDLVAEVVSPESRGRDWEDKFAQYAAAGVREYWLLDREQGRTEAFSLGEDGGYRRIAPDAGAIRSVVLPGFYLRLEWLLAPEPPDEDEVDRELLGQ